VLRDCVHGSNMHANWTNINAVLDYYCLNKFTWLTTNRFRSFSRRLKWSSQQNSTHQVYRQCRIACWCSRHYNTNSKVALHCCWMQAANCDERSEHPHWILKAFLFESYFNFMNYCFQPFKPLKVRAFYINSFVLCATNW